MRRAVPLLPSTVFGCRGADCIDRAQPPVCLRVKDPNSHTTRGRSRCSMRHVARMLRRDRLLWGLPLRCVEGLRTATSRRQSQRSQVGHTQHPRRPPTAALHWATSANRGVTPLLARNPLSGIALPTERDPRRPILHDKTVEKLVAAAMQVDSDRLPVLIAARECVLVGQQTTPRMVRPA
jgi:hypothetical protein